LGGAAQGRFFPDGDNDHVGRRDPEGTGVVGRAHDGDGNADVFLGQQIAEVELADGDFVMDAEMNTEPNDRGKRDREELQPEIFQNEIGENHRYLSVTLMTGWLALDDPWLS